MTSRIVDVDIILLVKNWVWAATALGPIFGTDPMRIAARLDPTKSAVLPAARLSIATSTEPVPNHLSATVVSASVWATTEPAVWDATAALKARMQDSGIIQTWPLIGVVTGLEVSQGIRDIEDPEAPHLSRLLFAIRYFTHPLPSI
jgi:hypothetical protein